ncbi:MAG: hypothetical protein ACT4OO_04440 [Nitrospiraceae bacterium]
MSGTPASSPTPSPTIGERLYRGLSYFSTLRPSFVFAVIIAYLPLTALGKQAPGNSRLGNLFV